MSIKTRALNVKENEHFGFSYCKKVAKFEAFTRHLCQAQYLNLLCTSLTL